MMFPGAVTGRDETIWDAWQFNKYLDDFGSTLFSEQRPLIEQKTSKTKSSEF